ncbi:MAG: rRNA adenine methyltransferase [Marinilabiliales bacterium]|nr:MAG: rRNA adenine methyltransferase [Marinilabiliales bacterium]
MPIDEGYIKFHCNWRAEDNLIDSEKIKELNQARTILKKHNLIGVYSNGIGFGNISKQIDGNQFIITGSATGQLKHLSTKEFSIVQSVNIEKNTVNCIGSIKASSESMSHAVIYNELPDVKAVIHIHHNKLWKKLLKTETKTSSTTEYGTPEMAYEIISLLRSKPGINTIVMAGHEEGLLFFGKSVQEALEITFKHYNKV